MPFTPSSPIRLYNTRKSRATPTDSHSITVTLKDTTMTKLRRSISVVNGDPALATPNTSETTDGQSSSTSRKEAAMAEHLDADSKVSDECPESIAGRSLSIHEALATKPQSEDATADEQPHTMTRVQSMFLDNASESEGSIEEDVEPIIGRASSVRVGKPQIVQNKPTKLPTIHAERIDRFKSNSQFLLEVERGPSQDAVMPPGTSVENSQRYTGQTIHPVSNMESDESLPKSIGPTQSDRKSVQDCVVYDSALPTGSTLRSIYPSVVSSEVAPTTNTDELHANDILKLDRMASPPLPLPGKGLSRRVTIRPADLVTRGHHDRQSFRESVVTTPYPARLPGGKTSMDFDGDKSEQSNEGRSRMNKQRLSFPGSPGEKDRFPSPERPELLLLDLNLVKNTNARVTLEIEITDKTTFDDEALFQQIKTVYQKQLLNWSRKVLSLVRKLQHVTTTGTTQSTHAHSHHAPFDSSDFLHHVHNPRLGRKRKTWLLWLRNHNASPASTQTPRIRQIDNLIRLSTRNRSIPHSRLSSQSTNDTDPEKRLSTTSDASSFLFSYSPAVPKFPFLSARHNKNDIPCANHSAAVATTHTHLTTQDIESTSRHPTITLHHSFHPTSIILLSLLNVLLAMSCAAIWIVFGVPGIRPGSDNRYQLAGVNGGSITVDWRLMAQGRVTTGLLIALFVLGGGCVVEAALLWAGRILL